MSKFTKDGLKPCIYSPTPGFWILLVSSTAALVPMLVIPFRSWHDAVENLTWRYSHGLVQR